MNTYYSLQGISRNALPNLVDSLAPFEIVIAKKNDHFLVFLNASSATLAAAKLHITHDPIEIQLNHGTVIKREIQRRFSEIPFQLVQQETDFCHTLNGMKNGNYIHLSLVPSDPLFLPRDWNYPHEIQSEFHGRKPYLLHLEVSPGLKALMISDLNVTGSSFTVADKNSSGNTRKIEGNMFSVHEAHILMQGLNKTIRKLFPGTLETLFEPGMGNIMPNAAYNIGCCGEKAVGFSSNDILGSICIAGMSGSGKTTLMKQLVQAVHQDQVPIIIFAPIKNDFSRAFPECTLYRYGDIEHPLLLSMTDLPHEDSSAAYAAKALSQIVSLGDADSMLPMIFQNAFSASFAKRVEVELTDVLGASLKELNGYKGNANFNSMKAAVINRIKTAYRVFPCTRSNINPEGLFRKNEITIIELEGMESTQRRTLATIFLARFISSVRKALQPQKLRKLQCVLLIDELHELLREDYQNDPFRDLLISALTTLQANGVGHILADQRMDMFGALAENCASRIVMKHTPSELVRTLFSLSSDSEVFDLLPFLTVGQGIFLKNGYSAIPFASKLEKDNSACSPLSTSTLQKYRPFPSCDAVCESCNHCVRTTVYNQVLRMSYQTDYPNQYHHPDANDSDLERKRKRKDALNAAYNYCLNNNSPENSNFDMKVYKECLKREILRRFSFSFR